MKNTSFGQGTDGQVHGCVISKKSDFRSDLHLEVINVCQKRAWVREQSPVGHRMRQEFYQR